MGQFVNLIRKKLGMEPRRNITLTGKEPNEVIVNRDTMKEDGYPISAIPTRAIRSTRPLVNNPIDGEVGDIGYDKDLEKKDSENTNLRRRKAYNRLVQVGIKEGADDLFPSVDLPSGKPDSSIPTTSPVPTVLPKKKTVKEGMFAADISNGDTGESGSPNNSMEGIPVRSNLDVCGAGQRVKINYAGEEKYGRIHSSHKDHEGKTHRQISLDDGGNLYVHPDHDHVKITPMKESADFAAMHVGIPTSGKQDNDDAQEIKSPVDGGLQRGSKVKINKPGYEGHGNIDFFDKDSGKYIVSVSGYGHNLHLDKADIEPMKESVSLEKPNLTSHHGTELVSLGRAEILRIKRLLRQLQKKNKKSIATHLTKLQQPSQSWRNKMSEESGDE